MKCLLLPEALLQQCQVTFPKATGIETAGRASGVIQANVSSKPSDAEKWEGVDRYESFQLGSIFDLIP